MSFDDMDSNDNPNNILIIVLIKISIVILIIIRTRDWNSKIFLEEMKIGKSKILRRNKDRKK